MRLSAQRLRIAAMEAARGSLDVLVHIGFEGPAAIADRAAARGLAVRVHRLFAADRVPSLDTVERLVVMGGPMGALDDADHPWLPDVRSLLARAVAAGTPVLGVCLGAQLLAAALGARIRRGPAPEIGAGRVRLTAAAARDPVLGVVGGGDLAVFHWHGDTFDLPDGALLLASSDAYAHQAFRVAHAWGLQFHVELRAGDAASVSSHLGPARGVTSAELAAIEPTGRQIVDAFLDLPTEARPLDTTTKDRVRA
jgi:GMP synthase-like glutamine amidotransferase